MTAYADRERHGVIETIYEAGKMYCFEGLERDDVQKTVNNANLRLHWIWPYDLEADLVRAEEEFLKLVGSTGELVRETTVLSTVMYQETHSVAAGIAA